MSEIEKKGAYSPKFESGNSGPKLAPKYPLAIKPRPTVMRATAEACGRMRLNNLENRDSTFLKIEMQNTVLTMTKPMNAQKTTWPRLLTSTAHISKGADEMP